MDLKKKVFNGILGGMVIGLGCMVFLSVDNKYLGAFLFSIGLLTVCQMGLGLFTGILCRSNDVKEILVTLLTNAAGIAFMAFLFVLMGGRDKMNAVAAGKLQKTPIQLLAAGILCEFCIYIAVIGYGRVKSDIGRNLDIILGVMVFILAGFEHSIADIFYFCGDFSWDRITSFLLVAAGNVVGAVLFRFLMALRETETK